jgi:hypothetical protein
VRTHVIENRRKPMEAWAAYSVTPKTDKSIQVDTLGLSQGGGCIHRLRGAKLVDFATVATVHPVLVEHCIVTQPR